MQMVLNYGGARAIYNLPNIIIDIILHIATSLHLYLRTILTSPMGVKLEQGFALYFNIMVCYKPLSFSSNKA